MGKLLLFAGILAAGAGAEVLDRTAVTVGSDVITESEVIEEVRVTALLNGEPADLSAAGRRAAAERLVDQYLIRREMSLEGFDNKPTGAEVNQTLRNLIQGRFHGETAYQQALARYGVTAAQLKQHLKWQIEALRFTDTRFRTAIPPPPAQGQAERPTPGSEAEPARPLQGGSASRQPAQDASVDQRMEEWLKRTRQQTRVNFLPEAFQ